MLSAEQNKRVMACHAVLDRQRRPFNGERIGHRIVSIDRPYIRPIVKGKENRQVEFGAKVNNIRIDGISFIGHHPFGPFNGGIRSKDCIECHKELTGIGAKRVGSDTIYADNGNRKYRTGQGITTCSVRKGSGPEDEDAGVSTAGRITGTPCATSMEGSPGYRSLSLCPYVSKLRLSESRQACFPCRT